MGCPPLVRIIYVPSSGFLHLLLGDPIDHCIPWDASGASILLAEPFLGIQYILTPLANHVIPSGFSSLVLPGYVWNTMEECVLLFSCDTL